MGGCAGLHRGLAGVWGVTWKGLCPIGTGGMLSIVLLGHCFPALDVPMVQEFDMSFESRQVAKCDACGHVWLPGGELPRRCAKCKSAKWNANAAPSAPMASAVIDDGLEAVEIRMSPGDRRQVEHMAKQAGKSVTDLIMARVWGEVSDSGGQVAAPVPAAAPFGDKLADLKARFNLKTAAHVEESGPATPPSRADQPKAVNDRPFSLRDCHQVWANPGYDNQGVMQDRETLRYWPVVCTAPQASKSVATLEEAQALLPD
jgi:hypothetical protein